jgi:hypothetical protein
MLKHKGTPRKIKYRSEHSRTSDELQLSFENVNNGKSDERRMNNERKDPSSGTKETKQKWYSSLLEKHL